MINIIQAMPGDLQNAVKFYCELITSMREREFRPDWKMGIYPTEQILLDAIIKKTMYFTYFENILAGIMILNRNYPPEYETVKWQTDAEKSEIMIIHALAVSAVYQGKGIAKQMVAAAVEISKQNKAKTIRLDVLEKNIPAAKLYLSAGFKYIDSVKMFYEDTGWASFRLYELVLQTQ